MLDYSFTRLIASHRVLTYLSVYCLLIMVLLQECYSMEIVESKKSPWITHNTQLDYRIRLYYSSLRI